MVIMPITLTMAGAATLINVWLAYRVGRTRISRKVPYGDGGDLLMVKRMRAQSNFVEYTPFFLILLGLIEYSQGSQEWLWGAGILYILARIAHPFGMDRATPNWLRSFGIVVTLVVLTGLALYAIAIPYLQRAQDSRVNYAMTDQERAST